MFGERLRQADQSLQAAERLDAGDPQLYAEWIVVGMGMDSPRSTVEAHFARGARVVPAHASLYTDMAVYLLPRWEGRPGEVGIFADRAVNLSRAQVGCAMYAAIALTVIRYEGENTFKTTGLTWPKAKQGMLDLLRRYHNAAIIREQYARLAVCANDRDAAWEGLRDLHSPADPRLWGNREYFDRCRVWAGDGR